jgi:Uma2 family endonuclease
MTESNAVRRWTVEDFFAVAEGRKLELWDGWPRGPKVFERRHGPFARFVVESRLLRWLGDAIEPGGLVGPGAPVASGRLVLPPPDLAYFPAEAIPPPERWAGLVEVAPALAVEVLGPVDHPEVVADDAAAYLEAGVRIVWAVDPRQRTVTVYQPDLTARVLREGDVLDGGEVLPEFRLSLAELFA